MPSWIQQGCMEYLKRFPKHFAVQLIEVASKKYSSHYPIEHIKKEETEKLLEKAPAQSCIIPLDPSGKLLSTEQLAKQLELLQTKEKNLTFLIGGAEGLDKNMLHKSHDIWSISPMTFPHPLVRVIWIEQLYRVSTILSGHPYHRGSRN